MSRDFNIVCITEGGIPMLGFPSFTSIEPEPKVLRIESIYKNFRLCTNKLIQKQRRHGKLFNKTEHKYLKLITDAEDVS